MKTLQLTWAAFETIVSDKKLSIHYVTTEHSYYHIWTTGMAIEYECEVKIDSPANADQQDFEDNYKDAANAPSTPQSADGLPKVLSTVGEDNKKRIYIFGDSKEIAGSTDVLETVLTQKVYLQGVRVFIKDAQWGDKLSFKVGTGTGASFSSLKDWGKDIPITDKVGWQECEYKNTSVSKVSNGLTLHTKYTQFDNQVTKRLIVHYIVHLDI